MQRLRKNQLRLRAEGVEVGPDGLDLARWRWDPPIAEWPWQVPPGGADGP